jgi:hypothetical protein
MASPILYDPRTNGHPVPWHHDANGEALVVDIMAKLKPDRFVETGSHMGWTDMWMAQHYPGLRIFTVELDPEYARTAQYNLAHYPNVTARQGNSPEFLAAHRREFSEGLTFFFLDAHFWSVVPLREELKFVVSLDRHVTLIDDFYCKDPDFDGDTFEGTDDKPGKQNNLAYLADIIGPRIWRPSYPAQPPWHKGYGLIWKGVDYTPPSTMKEDVLP